MQPAGPIEYAFKVFVVWLVQLTVALLIEVGLMCAITWTIHFMLLPFGINTKTWGMKETEDICE